MTQSTARSEHRIEIVDLPEEGTKNQKKSLRLSLLIVLGVSLIAAILLLRGNARQAED